MRMHTNRSKFQYKVNKIIFEIIFYAPISKNEIPTHSKTNKASVQHTCLLKVGASLVPPRRAGRSFRRNASLAVSCWRSFVRVSSRKCSQTLFNDLYFSKQFSVNEFNSEKRFSSMSLKLKQDFPCILFLSSLLMLSNNSG